MARLKTDKTVALVRYSQSAVVINRINMNNLTINFRYVVIMFCLIGLELDI